MRKSATYCATRVGLGICFLLYGEANSKQEADIEPIEMEQDTENEETPIKVVCAPSMSKAGDYIANAKDIRIQFSHIVIIDGKRNETDFVGSGYNYEYRRGFVSSINTDSTIEYWYNSDDYILSTDNGLSDSKDTVDIILRETGILDDNLNVINKVIDKLQGEESVRVDYITKHAVYQITTYDELDNLPITTNNSVEKVFWQALIPYDTTDDMTVVMNVYFKPNDNKIECERFYYLISIDTGVSYEPPNIMFESEDYE